MWDAWNIIAEGGVVHLVDKNTEETSGLFVWIGLELGVDLDNECRSHGGEETGLPFKLERADLGNAEDPQISV